jgi:acyl-CoA synthetase (AMP-forming)/AMP-acid ligase II
MIAPSPYAYPIAPDTVFGLIEATARRAPDAMALLDSSGSAMTYAQLAGRIAAIGAALQILGVESNDRVAIALPDGAQAPTIVLGIASAAIACPLNPAYRTAEFEHFLGSLDAQVLITDTADATIAVAAARARGLRVIDTAELLLACGDSGATNFDRAADLRRSNGPALLLHTSGTTSRPKLVPLTHDNLTASARTIAEWLALTPGDRCVSVMPLFHIHGIVGGLLSSFAAGASVACTGGFSSSTFLQTLSATEATWYTAVPTMHQAIVARSSIEPPPRPLRFVRSSSAPLAPATARALEELFACPVLEAYGMTEAAHQIRSNPLPPRQRRFGSVGLAAGVDVDIVGDHGTPLPPGDVGEIVIRGRNVMGGYDGNPAANADAFVRGWFRTGDLGRFDDDSYLYITGRIKEMINRGGEKISPREIDDVLIEHPAVAHAVAFAIPDDRLGEDVGAAVVPVTGATVDPDELVRFAATRLADFKLPRRIIIVDRIPLGPTGKVQRIGLAAAFGLDGTGSATAGTPADPSPFEVALKTIWIDVLGTDTIGRDTDFFALGGDSLLAARVIARIRRDLERDLAITAFFGAPTLQSMAREIELARPIESESSA